MKIQSLLIAATLAFVPATVSFADDAKKEALKKAKEKAKEAAIEAAKKEAKEKIEAKQEKAEKAADKKAAAAAADAKASEEATKAENETHSKHLGAIERLEQIATATNNEALKAKVATLKEKETKRHDMAMPAAPAAAPAK
jgi:colicin import membrane protein